MKKFDCYDMRCSGEKRVFSFDQKLRSRGLRVVGAASIRHCFHFSVFALFSPSSPV